MAKSFASGVAVYDITSSSPLVTGSTFFVARCYLRPYWRLLITRLGTVGIWTRERLIC